MIDPMKHSLLHQQYDQTLRENERLRSELAAARARVTELERLVYNSYPHMCRDDHPQIGHSEDELCPVCALRHDIDRHVQIGADQAQELEELREQLAAARAESTKLRGWVNDAEQAAGREQRRAERAEADLAAARATIDTMQGGYDRAAKMILDLRSDLAAARDLLKEASDDWVPHASSLSAAIVDLLRRTKK